jgi:hypothetical protein
MVVAVKTWVFLFLVSFFPAVGMVHEGDSEGEKFKIKASKNNDHVAVRANKEKTEFIIRSPEGISQAVIERKCEKWPETVVLRLHLKGLESFRASNGKVKIGAAVSSGPGKLSYTVWKDGMREVPLDEKSSLRLKIIALDSDGKVTEKLALGGYFEITLPRAFFEGNPKSITLDWVDFFRF